MARCKFKCQAVTNYEHGSKIVLLPVLTGSKENEDFYKWTPAGEINLEIVNLEVAKQYVPGKEYYIDITEAEE